ncbi:MAG: hypothetical protein AUG89_09900 [Acidobacteria bacterium 13_1_20CM_4_56_7]|jgi:hypothetical protein|nr:MAG: hypothetical protein AUG89_09900 [Acidobacteria bacterium 13_1_20CM_4_56_7]
MRCSNHQIFEFAFGLTESRDQKSAERAFIFDYPENSVGSSGLKYSLVSLFGPIDGWRPTRECKDRTNILGGGVAQLRC